LKTYEITIRPLSGFGTPLKGDTLFGQICWQAAYDSSLFGTSIDDLLFDYGEKPFIVVSSAYLRLVRDGRTEYALKRPDLPTERLIDLNKGSKREFLRERKRYKSRKWACVGEQKTMGSLRSLDLVSETELFETIAGLASGSTVTIFSQPHNSINRLTNTTGEGGFAPYSVTQHTYLPGVLLSVFVGVTETLDVSQVTNTLERIGRLGFGKDASTGLGKFAVEGSREIDLASLGSQKPDACFTLGPCVPARNTTKTAYYFVPFTRFGRHGDVLAKSSNPFKNPVIMADEGAVFVPSDSTTFEGPYIGSAVTGTSKAMPASVAQGYSLYIPVRMEE
jgi:CRISPR-associated protein Csm4